MLHYLLLEELAVLVFGDDLHHIILSYRPVETVPEGFAYDRAPWWVWSAYTTMNILKQLDAFISEDTPHHHTVGALSI
jgi:hypothetical protein